MKKRAVSMIVSYVILIVIAVGISVLVYNSLKLYLPSDKPTCPPEISLIIEETFCNNSYLTLSLKNKGLFNVSAVYIRMANVSRATRIQINQDKSILDKPIAPGGTWEWLGNVTSGPIENSDGTYPSIVTSDGMYTIEIQPAVISGQKIILCEHAVITEDIYCEAGDGSAPE